MRLNRRERIVAPNRGEANGRAYRIDGLIGRIESLPDEKARTVLSECIQKVLALRGDALERVLAITNDPDGSRQCVYERILEDNTIRCVTLVHGLYPLSFEVRPQRARPSFVRRAVEGYWEPSAGVGRQVGGASPGTGHERRIDA